MVLNLERSSNDIALIKSTHEGPFRLTVRVGPQQR